jgi:hypothetical protein
MIQARPADEAGKKGTEPENAGLVAGGDAGPWSIAIDENLDKKDDWALVIQFHNHYFACQLLNLSVPRQVLGFLSNPASPPLGIGKFGQAAVELRFDHEVDRCFLVVGPRSKSTLHLAIEGPDLETFVAAWKLVVADLPERGPAGKSH